MVVLLQLFFLTSQDRQKHAPTAFDGYPMTQKAAQSGKAVGAAVPVRHRRHGFSSCNDSELPPGTATEPLAKYRNWGGAIRPQILVLRNLCLSIFWAGSGLTVGARNHLERVDVCLIGSLIATIGQIRWGSTVIILA